jgi:hypothetical protein
MQFFLAVEDTATPKLEQIISDMGGVAFERVIEAGLPVVLDAVVKNAPYDQGGLKSSITSETLRTSPGIVEGIVGSKLFYAPFQEFGTGVFAGKSPHRPPSGALDGWASRHGIPNGYLVARAIGLRGGLRPVGFFKRALAEREGAALAQIYNAFEGIIQ